MTGLVGFRSGDPRVTGGWREVTAAVDAYVARTAEILALAVPGKYEVLRGTQPWCRGQFAGVAVRPGRDVPPGWRSAGGVAVPDRRRAAGRWVADALAAEQYPGDPRQALIGMPGHLLTAAGCGVELLEDCAAVHVTLPAAGRELGGHPGLAEIDFTVWERVDPQRYHGARRSGPLGAGTCGQRGAGLVSSGAARG